MVDHFGRDVLVCWVVCCVMCKRMLLVTDKATCSDMKLAIIVEKREVTLTPIL